MKLHGLEMTWQAVDDRLDTLCTAPTAREAMAQLYPAALEPQQLFLGRGLAARGGECCPLLVLRARIVLEEDAPRIVPVDDRYQLCSDTLHAVFGVDRDTLRNMSDMLEDAAPETLRLFQLLSQSAGGDLEQAAGRAAQGDAEQLMGAIRQLMNDPEGQRLIGQMKRSLQ